MYRNIYVCITFALQLVGAGLNLIIEYVLNCSWWGGRADNTDHIRSTKRLNIQKTVRNV